MRCRSGKLRQGRKAATVVTLYMRRRVPGHLLPPLLKSRVMGGEYENVGAGLYRDSSLPFFLIETIAG